jgi:hypothetical protein
MGRGAVVKITTSARPTTLHNGRTRVGVNLDHEKWARTRFQPPLTSRPHESTLASGDRHRGTLLAMGLAVVTPPVELGGLPPNSMCVGKRSVEIV